MTDSKNHLRGVLYCLLCYSVWGLFPLYWKLLSEVSPVEVLMHRILWSFVFMYLFCVVWKKKSLRPVFNDTKQTLKLALCGIIISVNWGLYIWAISNDHVVDASLGYYINPLLNVLLGILFFRERLNRAQILAFVLAFSGGAYLTYDYGSLPWISLILGISFAIYASIKKTLTVSSLQGLTVETLLITPIALLYLTFLFTKHENAIFTVSPLITFLLIMAGVVTALPLFWFGIAANKIPLSTIGFMQYISPTLQLLIGILVFGEAFTTAHIVCFCCIWAGLLVYSTDMIKIVSLRWNKNRSE
jgi:chloramphenicol-sensitive protein RarD